LTTSSSTTLPHFRGRAGRPFLTMLVNKLHKVIA
jgi:hypothetical protein